MSRLLAIVLALCAALPTQAWARFAEMCDERDACSCRHDDTDVPLVPAVQRVDCCEAPCTADLPPTPATPSPRDEVAEGGTAAPLDVAHVAVALSDASRIPPAPTRGPPRAVFSLVRHRLL